MAELVALALLVLTTGMAVAPTVRTAAASASPPPSRWVAVSVATLWVEPDQGRRIDAPAVANPADPRGWVAAMTVAQKRWLIGRLETQALYGTRVYLLRTSGSWSKVAVKGQPTPRNRWGYPGWLPTAQLTEVAPAMTLQNAPRMAIIRRRTAWLWQTSDLAGRLLELSYGTRLAVVAWTDDFAEVVTLDGTNVFVSRGAVRLRDPDRPWPKLTGVKLVTQAKKFQGLRFLYGGTSGYGFDCSGFMHTVYRALGTTISRDADAQFTTGRRVVLRSALHPGDLVFFRDSSGHVHHVGMYVGSGRMIHSPATGEVVRLTSIYTAHYFSEFAGGRRFTR